MVQVAPQRRDGLGAGAPSILREARTGHVEMMLREEHEAELADSRGWSAAMNPCSIVQLRSLIDRTTSAASYPASTWSIAASPTAWPPANRGDSAPSPPS